MEQTPARLGAAFVFAEGRDRRHHGLGGDEAPEESALALARVAEEEVSIQRVELEPLTEVIDRRGHGASSSGPSREIEAGGRSGRAGAAR